MSTNKIIAELDAEQMSREIPDFAPGDTLVVQVKVCLLYTSPSPRDLSTSRMPSSA